MVARLIILWFCIATIAALASWWLAVRARRETLWIRIALASALLVGCIASYLVFGSSVQKTFAAVALYFSVWSAVYAAAALSAGTIVGSLIALQVSHRPS